MGTGIGRNLVEVASLLGGIALIALILNKSEAAAKLVTTGADAYGDLLKIVTLQNSF